MGNGQWAMGNGQWAMGHEENVMRHVAIGLIISVVSFSATSAYAQDAKIEAAAWQKVAETIELGSKVKVQTANGKHISGTLMRVDTDAILLKRNTRRPEPALTVRFADMAKLERDKPGGGMHIARAIGVGLAAGAGVFFSLVLIAMQLD
jgi:hypothetical protein